MESSNQYKNMTLGPEITKRRKKPFFLQRLEYEENYLSFEKNFEIWAI